MVVPRFAHTPYDGSSKPFAIGLRPLDPATWIEIDEHFDAYVAEKRRLYATIPDKVFVEEADTDGAQREVLDLVREATAASPVEGASSFTVLNEPALKTASLLVQEDLVLMRRGVDGWRLAAASLCFPSSWSLREKFGRPLQEIHAPVPGFGPGTRTADLIHRMFDNLKVDQPVERLNWSVQANEALYHPLSDRGRDLRAADPESKFPSSDATRAFIRVERQTLRKLAFSGDILFTIRIYLDPISVLAAQPDRMRLAWSFADQIASLDRAQLDYKGLTADRDRLVEHLEAMARPGVSPVSTE